MPYKVCPKCAKNNGVRTYVCSCGYNYTSAQKITPTSTPKPVETKTITKPVAKTTPTRSNPYNYCVLTPAGPCPIKPANCSYNEMPDRDSVEEWTRAIKKHGLNHEKNYAADAVVYWISHFWDWRLHEQIKGIVIDAFYATEPDDAECE